MIKNNTPLYNLQSSYERGWSWTAHFRLPELQPRQTVLDTLHEATEGIRFSPKLPWAYVAEFGLSGILQGPDEEAEMVSDVIFAQDPSQRYGMREAPEVDNYVVGIAERHKWSEIYEGDGNEWGPMRTILGRGKGQYGGEEAFTVDETRALLDGESPLYVFGSGCIFSDRPGWEKPYTEPGVILEAEDRGPQDVVHKARVVQALSELAFQLDRQDRWVLEHETGTEVYKLNPAVLQADS